VIDRLVHNAEIVALKGDSYPLRNRDLASPRETTERNPEASPTKVSPATPARTPREREREREREGGCFSTGARGCIFSWP
jgi:hypothetical protein